MTGEKAKENREIHLQLTSNFEVNLTMETEMIQKLLPREVEVETSIVDITSLIFPKLQQKNRDIDIRFIPSW